MRANLKTLFCNSQLIDEEITAFLAQDPEYVQRKQEFYKTAHEIATLVGFDLYDLFERRMGDYLNRMADLYYLFGLGLRQELLQAMNQQPANPPLL